MRVKIETTLDVDAEAWAESFGVEPSAVRDDVKVYMAATCLEQLQAIGCHDEEATARYIARLERAGAERREFAEAHAEGLHDDVPREFCPECDRRAENERTARLWRQDARV